MADHLRERVVTSETRSPSFDGLLVKQRRDCGLWTTDYGLLLIGQIEQNETSRLRTSIKRGLKVIQVFSLRPSCTVFAKLYPKAFSERAVDQA